MSSFKLLPHQETLFKKCCAFEQGDVVTENETINTRIGIIGDKAGSGKSFVMLALTCAACPKRDMYKYVADNLFSVKVNMKAAREDDVGPSIVVAHHSLMRQWRENVELYDGGLKAKVLYVTRKGDVEKQTCDSIKKYSIIVLSSSVYGQFCSAFTTVCFKRMFVDEADTILLNSQVVHALFYWFVTSSYPNLMNPHGQLLYNNEMNKHVVVAPGIKNNGFVRDFFMYLHSEYLAYILVKNDDLVVDKSCALGEVEVMVVECLPPFSLCRTTMSLDNIINANANAKSSSELQVANIKERIGSNECPICFERIKEDDKGVLLCCANTFCVKCIVKWLTHTHACPICRSPNTIEDIRMLEGGSGACVGNNRIDGQNTQLVNFYNLIQDSKVEKMLIFSEYDYVFNAIIPHLTLQSISFSLLKGSGGRYERVLENYNNTNVSRTALFLDSDYYGCGLNLHATTDIIFFNKFDNEMEKKIIGSAQRIGRKTPLRVWYFIHKHESNYYFNGACN